MRREHPNNMVIVRVFFPFIFSFSHRWQGKVPQIVQQGTQFISAFTRAQLSKLLAAPMCDTFNGFRNYVIMAVLTDTGLWINEFLKLRKQDVDFVQMTLTVPKEMAKTRKTRTVPISCPVAKLHAELIAENEDFGSGRNALFYSVSVQNLHQTLSMNV
jgi:site-specific recombinase XerD